MQQRYFLYPWAADGDTAAVPMASQTGGYVSYQQGYTVNYEGDLATDPSAIAIERTKTNALLNDITLNLQNYQQYGTPEFIDATDNGGSAYQYDVNSMVRYSSSGESPFGLYVSLATNNTTLPTNTEAWAPLISAACFLAPQLKVFNITPSAINTSYTQTVTATASCNGWVTATLSFSVGTASMASGAYMTCFVTLDGANTVVCDGITNTAQTVFSISYYTKGQTINATYNMQTNGVLPDCEVQENCLFVFQPAL